MQHVGTRHYSDCHPVTREPFDLEDRLYRKTDMEFMLMIAGELPGDPPVERTLSLSEVFEWYQDCPQQIERAVIVNALRQGGPTHTA